MAAFIFRAVLVKAVVCGLLFYALSLGAPASSLAASSVAISKDEWSVYLRQNPKLKEADNRLNVTYRKLMDLTPPDKKQKLLSRQRAWLNERNRNAALRHAKGSAEYIETLMQATLAREADLQAEYDALRSVAALESAEPTKAPLPTEQSIRSPVVKKDAAFSAPKVREQSPAPILREAAPSTEPEITQPNAPLRSDLPVIAHKQAPATETGSLVRSKEKAPFTPARSAGRRDSPATRTENPKSTFPEDSSRATPQAAASAGAPQPNKTHVDDDLVVTVRPSSGKRSSERSAKRIHMTAAEFIQRYNAYAASYQSTHFPVKPDNIMNAGAQRTENYKIANNITVSFNYTDASKRPESVIFRGERFLSGVPRDRDEIAYSIVSILKTLNQDSTRHNADAEISGVMHSISKNIAGDSTRIWRNNGLLYVLSYVKQPDIFSMTVKPDTGKKRP